MNAQDIKIKILELELDYRMGGKYCWMPILELTAILQDYYLLKQKDASETN